MRKARKRVLSTLLAAVLALGLMPSFAFADGGDEGGFTAALSAWDDSLTIVQGGSDRIVANAGIYRDGSTEPLEYWQDDYTFNLTQSYTAQYKEADGEQYQDFGQGVFSTSGALLEFDLSNADSMKPGTYVVKVTGTFSGSYTPKRDGVEQTDQKEEFTGLTDTFRFTLIVTPNVENPTMSSTLEELTVDYATLGQQAIRIPLTIVQDGYDITSMCEVKLEVNENTQTIGAIDGVLYFYPYTAGVFVDTELKLTPVYDGEEFNNATMTLNVKVSNPDSVAFASITKNDQTTYYTDFKDALENAQEGDTITVMKSHIVHNLTIDKNVTVTGGKTLTVWTSASDDDPYNPAIVVNAGKTLTLDGIDVNIVGVQQDPEAGTSHGQAINLYNATAVDGSGEGAVLNLINGATLNMSGLEAAMVFPGTPQNTSQLATVNVGGGSQLIIDDVDGNASNGGIWNIADNSLVKVSNCGSHGLSAEIVNADSSTIAVNNVGLVGMIAKNISLVNGSPATVSGSGSKLAGTSSAWAPDGESYKRDVELKANGVLNVTGGSNLILQDNIADPNFEGRQADAFYVGENSNAAIVDSFFKGNLPDESSSANVYIVNSTVNGSPVDQEYVALINGKGYKTLAEAIAEVGNYETITLLKDIPNAVGITVAGGKNFTLDFANHTYTLTGPGAGSTGTETNGFQLLQNSTITFKNGTIRIAENATKIKRIIQNYANLTLDNMQIYAENQVGGENYALSFNNGNIVFKGNTSVFTTNDNTIAFDVCKFSSYPRTIVTFDESYTGTVNGVIFYDSPNASTHKLIIDGNGSFGSIETTPSSAATPSISVSGGTFARSLEGTGYLSEEVQYQVKHVTNDTFTYTKSLEDALAAAQPGDSVTAVNENGTTYTLTLKYNDNATADSTYTVESGAEITLPKPTRDGYTFQGWYDASGARVGAPYIVIADASLTAQWSANPTPVPTPEQFDVAVADVQNGAVELSAKTAKEGQKVTVTVTPDLGWELAQLTVADEDGDALELTENADGTYSFTMPAGDVTVHASFADAWENPFTDLSEDHWGYGAVRTANLLGLMKGIGGTTLFAPDDGLLREQAATVMWNLMGAGDVSRPEAPQADVDQSQWYAPYVNWAVDSKVMDGYSEDDFGVGDSLTREQFAAVVAKAVGADVDSADQAALGAFPDADGVSGWARATMAWAVEAGVLNGVGTEDGSRELQATRELTRAEMATMMVNAIEVGVLDFGA